MALTREDKLSFKENGYVVLYDMLSEEQIEAGLETIWQHLNVDRNDPSTWIGGGPRIPECGEDPALVNTLYGSPIYEAAESLAGKGKLTRPTLLGPMLNFPSGETEWSAPGGHLDGYYTPTNGVPEDTVGRFHLGVTIYLSDQQPRGGGFTVWPGTHTQSSEHFRTHSMLDVKGGNVSDIYNMPPPAEITGPRGTACLWHGGLVHSASKNCRDTIRFCLITRLRHADNDDILFEWPDDPWTYWDGID